MSLSNNAMSVLERRYIRKDETGNPAETVAGMFHRVAYHVAQAHTEPGAEHDALTAVYENMMSSLEFLPNTPTFTGAGTPLGQLAACFVLPIDDDIGKDSKAGIFSTLRNAALVQQSGGGVGFSFSRLRHRGDRVQKSAGVASGPVSFIKVYDAALSSVTRVEPQPQYMIGENVIGSAPVDFQVAKGPVEFMSVFNDAFAAIAQGKFPIYVYSTTDRPIISGGTRRGASMGVLRIDHPDILEFIGCKTNQEVLNGFNISVGITDEFMEAVEAKSTTFKLISPRTGHPVGVLVPDQLMDAIVDHAYNNGEPGVLFLDAINRKNPLPHLYKIETTNPCVTIDTLIMTSNGPVPVGQLIGVSFNTHEGSLCRKGFFFRDSVPTITIRTRNGNRLRCSAEHRIMLHNDRWVQARKLSVGDVVLIHGEKYQTDVVVAVIVNADGTTGLPICENVYDCTIESSFHCYVSNGFYSHNCG